MPTTQNQTQAAIEAIRRAQRSWTGADWTHEGPGTTADAVEECRGDNAENCTTCVRATADARRAKELGEKAIDELLYRQDPATASQYVHRAAALERNWGDDPSWRQAVEAVVVLAGEHLSAVETAGDWSVIDTSGQRWWPNEEAEQEIQASDDPKATVLRICCQTPNRGEWVS